MKKIFDYCRQPRAYADSVGLCLVLVEDGEDVEAIKKEFHKPKEWYEEKYFFSQELTEYVQDTYKGKVTHTGKLLLFNTRSEYTG